MICTRRRGKQVGAGRYNSVFAEALAANFYSRSVQELTDLNKVRGIPLTKAAKSHRTPLKGSMVEQYTPK